MERINREMEEAEKKRQYELSIKRLKDKIIQNSK